MGWNVRDDNCLGVAIVVGCITCRRLSSGLDEQKRAFYAGTLALSEQNSEGHVHVKNTLMHTGSFQKKKEKNMGLLCTCDSNLLPFLSLIFSGKSNI